MRALIGAACVEKRGAGRAVASKVGLRLGRQNGNQRCVKGYMSVLGAEDPGVRMRARQCIRTLWRLQESQRHVQAAQEQDPDEAGKQAPWSSGAGNEHPRRKGPDTASTGRGEFDPKQPQSAQGGGQECAVARSGPIVVGVRATPAR